ncbi:MAG: IS1380 family transposase [Magnetospirillum sp.]|nr:MAG: IS1380 family transposase [Magnetospirillum sp.]
MPTECSAELFRFVPVEKRAVVAGFDGGAMTSDAGSLLLGATDRAIRLVDRFAGCFTDGRNSGLIEHAVRTLVGQRVFGIALGYEDLNDHDHLRFDPLMAVLAGKLKARRKDCAPVAGKSTLNRLEHAPKGAPTRYRKIGHDGAAIERLLVDLFLEAYAAAPDEIILDLDATDDPIHGHQEGRLFHGYYDGYCYLPLYIFCGDHLLAAKLRQANIDGAAGAKEEVTRIVGQIRAKWPRVRIILRADSGFCREDLMAWCEANGVDFLFGLARNARLVAEIAAELADAEAQSQATGKPARRFKDFQWSTRKSWSRRRRVIGKAEWTQGEANPRFVVTTLSAKDGDGKTLYETVYCARGEMENRIKECRLDLFADRTSTATMRANQLRLWFASMAYVLLAALRRIALRQTQFARATCGSIRLKLLKIGALVATSVRRIKIAMASGYPWQTEWAEAYARLSAVTA